MYIDRSKMSHKELYDLAMAVMKDAANLSAKRGGRAAWSREDYNAGVEAFHQMYPGWDSEEAMTVDALSAGRDGG